MEFSLFILIILEKVIVFEIFSLLLFEEMSFSYLFVVNHVKESIAVFLLKVIKYFGRYNSSPSWVKPPGAVLLPYNQS